MVRLMHWANPEERRNLGQARRKQVGRQEHNQLNPKARKTPALELVAHSMRGRVPALIRLKYQLMADSPFGYFRGAVPVMAADLAMLPSTGIVSQLCGDAHVRNLGAYAAPDGRLVFDINDFDETIRGPFEWDLKRMAASLVLAGRGSGHKESAAREAVEKCVERYAAQMRQFAQMPSIEVARCQVHRLGLVEPVHEALVKAERASPLHTLEQLTEPSSGKPGAGRCFPDRQFKEMKPTLTRVTGQQAAAVLAGLGPYRQMLEPQRQHLLSLYRPVDVAFKVVGTGSVGLRDYCIYFEGNGPADPLFLQIKEEPASAYAPYLPDAEPPRQNGQRVAEGQRACRCSPTRFSAGRTLAGATTWCASSTTTRVPSTWKTCPGPASRPTPRSAESCWPAATPAPLTRFCWPAMSAPATALPTLWPSSAASTPTRPKRTGRSFAAPAKSEPRPGPRRGQRVEQAAGKLGLVTGCDRGTCDSRSPWSPNAKDQGHPPSVERFTSLGWGPPAVAASLPSAMRLRKMGPILCVRIKRWATRLSASTHCGAMAGQIGVRFCRMNAHGNGAETSG